MLGYVMAMFKHTCTCMCMHSCVSACILVYVCVMFAYVLMYVHMRKPEEDIWYPLYDCTFFFLHGGPSMNLELGWWPVSPSEPLCLPHAGWGYRCACSPNQFISYASPWV